MTQTTPHTDAPEAAPDVLALAPTDDPAAVVLPPDDAATITPTPEGLLPCADCGAAWDGPVTETAHPVAVMTPGPFGSGRTREVRDSDASLIRRARFTRCADCTARDALAARLLAALDAPAGAGAARSRVGALGTSAARRRDAVAATLRALAVVGVDPARTPLLPRVEAAESDDPATAVTAARRLVATARRLSAYGGGTRWAWRYSPTWDAEPGTCSAAPWAYTHPDLQAAAREDVARLLAVHVAASAPPREVRPPAVDADDVPRGAVPVGGGCALCGVRSVQVSAANVAADPAGIDGVAATVWTPRTMSAVGLEVPSPGGRRVAGHTCPPCTDALADAAAVGPLAMTYALAARLLPGSARSPHLEEVEGVTAWAAVVLAATDHHRPPPKPSAPAEPWAHLYGSRPGPAATARRDALVEMLAGAVGVAPSSSPAYSRNGGR